MRQEIWRWNTQEKGTVLDAGFELGLPVVRTVALTHGVAALPTELNTTLEILLVLRNGGNHIIIPCYTAIVVGVYIYV